MQHQYDSLSQQMYHRIYRLSQHHHDPMLIAAALKLPVKTVQSVLDRFESHGHDDYDSDDGGEEGAGSALHDEPVIALFPKSRHVVMDVSGRLVAANRAALQEELNNVQSSGLDFRAIAVRMADVKEIDEASLMEIVNFVLAIGNKSKFVALLDPSPVVDEVIVRAGMEERMAVFGTEGAFEENAFKNAQGSDHRRKRKVVRGPR